MHASPLPTASRIGNDQRMTEPGPLRPRLDACRAAPGAWQDSYTALIDRLRRAKVGQSVPQNGEQAHDFALPDRNGRLHRLSDLAAGGPVVLSFNRGSWCPYCEQELLAWGERLDQLDRAGARLVILTPETGGRMSGLSDLVGPRATVLCDADLGVALRYGLAFPVGAEILRQFLDDGFDLAAVNGSGGGFLPIPATLLIDRNRTVRFAMAEPDFTQRAEPADVLAAMAAISGIGTG